MSSSEPPDSLDKDPYDPQQAWEWQTLHDRITHMLDQFGQRNCIRQGDYWLLDDNWGWEVQQLEFQNLALLTPEIIRELQAGLTGYPKWSITIRVDVVGKEKDWPGMGIIIHPDEIIDELKREFLPPEFTDRVFASNPTSQLKMLVYDARSGIERLFTWRDA